MLDVPLPGQAPCLVVTGDVGLKLLAAATEAGHLLPAGGASRESRYHVHTVKLSRTDGLDMDDATLKPRRCRRAQPLLIPIDRSIGRRSPR